MSMIVVDPYQIDNEKAFCKGRRLPGQTSRSLSEGGNCPRLTIFLVVMSAASLAIGLVEPLIPAAFLGICGVAVGPIGASSVGLCASALLGVGLAIFLTWKSHGAADWQCMLLASFVAMAIGAIMSCLVHFTGHLVALTWLISPVYLLWAWGSAVGGR